MKIIYSPKGKEIVDDKKPSTIEKKEPEFKTNDFKKGEK